MIRRVVNSLYHRYNCCPPRVGQWFATSNGHVSAGLSGQCRKSEGCLPGAGAYLYPELPAGGVSVRKNV